jgi:DNA-3-methyladenine glycosylase I
MKRCNWSEGDKLDVKYHDTEWGVPVHDDRVLFEFLTLEGAQAGLSWRTVLHKRENYRLAFAEFDPEKVVRFDRARIESLLQDKGIIRNRLKVESTVSNARALLDIREEFGNFDAYIWDFVGGEPLVNHWRNMSEVPTSTPQSDAMSKSLKKRGFRFVGTTICYAYMQACGLVNDHLTECFRYHEV